MTFAELQTELFRRLDEDSVAPSFWSLTDIKRALNEGYAELSDASEWYERALMLPRLSNRTYYDLRAIVGTSFLSPRRCYNAVSSTWLQCVNLRELDNRTYQRWEVNTGEPAKMMQRGAWWFGVYPKPSEDGDGNNLRLYCTAMPPPMVLDQDRPGFPREFHPGIVAYGLFDLLAQEAETAKAMQHYGEYSAIETALTRHVRSRIQMDRINTLKG